MSHVLFVDTTMYSFSRFFFFNDTATTEIYTLSLHDALPILIRHGGKWCRSLQAPRPPRRAYAPLSAGLSVLDRKSTRLNSSHLGISYAVFCLKKKNTAVKRHWPCRRTGAHHRDVTIN